MGPYHPHRAHSSSSRRRPARAPVAALVAPSRAVRPLVVTLDVGTSSVRAALYDRIGRRFREPWVQLAYRMEVTAEGGVSVPVAQLLTVVDDVLDAFASEAGELLDDAVAVGISCFLHSLVGLDEDGRPLTPVYSWADTTSAPAVEDLRRALPEEPTRQRTGAPFHASYWPARIHHLRAREGRDDRAISGWAGFPELLIEHLCGERLVGASLASATGLFGRDEGRWDPGLMAVLGLTADRLPRLVDDGTPTAGLASRHHDRWPRLARLRWHVPWSDAASSNVGLGCIGADRAALIVGTSGAMRVLTAVSPPHIPQGLFAFRLGGKLTLLGGQLSEGGAAVAWLSQLTGVAPRRLEALASEQPPDAHGLTVLPYLTGERGPGYHSDARAVLSGISLRTDAAALHRALLEGIAFRFAHLDARLSESLPGPPAVVVSGGALARSPLWRQIVADALGRDVEASVVGESSSRGVAILVLDASGAIESIDSAPIPRSRMVWADGETHSRYREAIERQTDLYRRILES